MQILVVSSTLLGMTVKMKTLEIDYKMSLEFSSPVTEQYFLLRCVPVSQGCQVVVSRNLEITPQTPITTFTDSFGNRVYQGLIEKSHSSFSFHSTAKVLVDGENGIHARCQPYFKYETELTRCSKKMKEFLYETFKDSELLESIKAKKIKNSKIKEFALVLMNAVHQKIKYEPSSTNIKTTAAEAFEKEKGVCQDFSHIFISLCREAGVPSRYIAGVSVGEGATHAWSDFFVPYDDYISNDASLIEGRWFGADCTRNKIADDIYCILSSGRDFEDCKVDVGIFRGNADQIMTVFVKTSESEK